MDKRMKEEKLKREIQIKLTAEQIDSIINELENTPHIIFKTLKYNIIIDRLRSKYDN